MNFIRKMTNQLRLLVWGAFVDNPHQLLYLCVVCCFLVFIKISAITINSEEHT